jgi:hypothetical protein
LDFCGDLNSQRKGNEEKIKKKERKLEGKHLLNLNVSS